jgi:sugar/nucleoside kinase (ribokinase family)
VKRRANLNDVAAAAGVSVGTASNVLNDPDKVRPVTRDRVLRAIRDLGYAPAVKMPALVDLPASDPAKAGRPLLVSAGYISIDTIVPIDVMPHRGDRVTADRILTELGGPATNVAVAAAAIGGRFALDVELATAIGQDPDSLWALRLLSKRGVHARAVRVPQDGRLSRCIVLVEPGGIRTKINERLELSDEDLVSHLEPLPSKRRRHIHVDGYQVERLLPALERLRSQGWTASTQDTGLAEKFKTMDGFRAFASSLDIVVINRSTATKVLGGALSPDQVVNRFNAFLQGSGIAAEVVVTLGAAGAAVLRPSLEPTYGHALPVRVVDGTGAGDCFCGVYIAQRLHEMPPETAVRSACIAASLSMTAPGAQGFRSSLRDIEEIQMADYE